MTSLLTSNPDVQSATGLMLLGEAPRLSIALQQALVAYLASGGQITDSVVVTLTVSSETQAIGAGITSRFNLLRYFDLR